MAEQKNQPVNYIDARYHPIRSLNNTKDPRIITLRTLDFAGLAETVPYPILLAATQVAERKLVDARLAQGIRMNHSQDSDIHGEGEPRGRLGTAIEHIVEHAICTVLDRWGDPSEQASGLTNWSDPESEKVVVHIAPPPSMDMGAAKKMIDHIINSIIRQYRQTGEINLEAIEMPPENTE